MHPDSSSVDVVVVIGTGLMAPGIAAAAAAAGAAVRIVGRDTEKARTATDRARQHAGNADGEMIRTAPLEAASFEDADIVLEAVTEDEEVKAEVFGLIEPWMPDESVLATNTSSLSLTRLAQSLDRPQNLAGLHFLNPAHLTTVVEVVRATQTSDRTHRVVASFARAMGKTPITVKRDVPGFVWNRLQFAVLRESLHLLEEGVSDIASIDAALSDGLAPRWLAGGAFATADMGGIATFLLVAEQLYPELSRTETVPGSLKQRGERSLTFYAWSDSARRSIEELRATALSDGREISRRRRELMPPPTEV